jgi:hypothetical protein
MSAILLLRILLSTTSIVLAKSSLSALSLSRRCGLQRKCEIMGRWNKRMDQMAAVLGETGSFSGLATKSQKTTIRTSKKHLRISPMRLIQTMASNCIQHLATPLLKGPATDSFLELNLGEERWKGWIHSQIRAFILAVFTNFGLSILGYWVMIWMVM